MSFALPSVKVKPTGADSFGVNDEFVGQNLMTYGLTSAKQNTDILHPLCESESKYHDNINKMNMTILQNTQGLHAPLRIAMELKTAKKIGRLPFLPSSNVMLDSLTGRDLDIGPEDLFNTPEFLEVSRQPHAAVEKSMGLL